MTTEQAWLGNEAETDQNTMDPNKLLLRLERMAQRATTSFENGELDTGIRCLKNALKVALFARALTTTNEGLRQ